VERVVGRAVGEEVRKGEGVKILEKEILAPRLEIKREETCGAGGKAHDAHFVPEQIVL
jgi:hypothetical protein